MNKEQYIQLLENPSKIDAKKTQQLEEVILEFPYFQSARSLQLKALKSTNSFKYNQNLKKTAAHTIDRKVLFEFITSKHFVNYESTEIQILEDIEVIDPEIIEVLHKKITASFTEEKEEPISVIEKESAADILEIGKPIEFNSSEPHSFNEWMQLISQKPISRDEIKEKTVENKSKPENKFELIDKFIASNPKIKPADKSTVFQPLNTSETSESDSLMTETLAKVYLEQKKYENAIKAYRILSLKYPEKSGFFADRIKAIKIIQKNKS